jgi:hypothetical protein
MNESLDAVLGIFLGDMEAPICGTELRQLIVNRVHSELPDQQMENATIVLTSDFPMILSTMWIKRKQETKRSVKARYEESIRTYKDRVRR